MNACREKTPAGQKTASGIFLRSYGQRTGKNRLQATDSRRVARPAPTKTASGRRNANAVDPSGLYTTSATSSFTVTAGNGSQPAGTVTSGYDADGNVISRSWTSGVTQTLTWDAFDRLIGVSQRDNSDNGYDWTAIYDGLGRRLQTVQQPVVNNVASGAATTITSIYDPQVEFLEIGVNVNGVQAYKVYGPDINGSYGGLQGTGGLEATIMNGTGVTTGVLNDFFGNGVATISNGSVTWNPTKVAGYGPLPDSTATPLTDATQLAQATVWRGRRIDPTGFYYLGSRYYEPTSGRFLSCDPLSFAAGTSLYALCNGDPVNHWDPDGRCSLDYNQGRPQYADTGAGPGFNTNISYNIPSGPGSNTDYSGSVVDFGGNADSGGQNADNNGSWWKVPDWLDKGVEAGGDSASVVGGLAGKTTFGWVGDNVLPTFYPSGFQGNQYVATTAVEDTAKAAGIAGFGLGMGLDVYQAATGQESKTQAATNIGVGAATLFIPFPADVIVGGGYMAAKDPAGFVKAAGPGMAGAAMPITSFGGF